VLSDGLVELFVAPVTPSGVGTRMRVNTALAAADARVSACYPTPGGGGLVYFAEQLQPGVTDVFYAPLTGASPGAPKRLNEGASVERDALDYAPVFAGPDLVLYAQRDVTDGPLTAYLVPIDGSEDPTPFSEDDVDASFGWVWVGD
jgi:hypothetical protein